MRHRRNHSRSINVIFYLTPDAFMGFFRLFRCVRTAAVLQNLDLFPWSGVNFNLGWIIFSRLSLSLEPASVDLFIGTVL